MSYCNLAFSQAGNWYHLGLLLYRTVILYLATVQHFTLIVYFSIIP